jgi:L-alanine-DL-glutamate epimerase-like enolase superfamily enzyme
MCGDANLPLNVTDIRTSGEARPLGRGPMRIADVEVINLLFSYPPGKGFRYAGGVVTSRVTSIIRLTTDDGMVGLGAAYSYPDLLRLIIERQLKPMLLGCDPREIEALWDKMYQMTRWYGRKGAAISALGGIDIALWDLRGKALGKPVYQLLGGTCPSAPAYASGLLWHDDVRDLEKEARRHCDRGFRRVKMRTGRSEEWDMERIAAVRNAIGPDGDLMVDGSHRYTLEMAERMGRFLAEKKVFWFEEPFPPEDLDSFVALRQRLRVPLAAGENEFGVQGFRELFRAKAVDIAQPDASRTGGISECVRIARMAADFGVRVAPHTWSDAVSLMANAHFVAATPNSITVEVDQTGNPLIEQLLAEPLVIKDGSLSLSDRPGLGIDLNAETLKKYELPAGQLIPDGNYSDLFFGQEYWITPAPYETSKQNEKALVGKKV